MQAKRINHNKVMTYGHRDHLADFVSGLREPGIEVEGDPARHEVAVTFADHELIAELPPIGAWYTVGLNWQAAKFELGCVTATRGARDLLKAAEQRTGKRLFASLLIRHVRGDWGEGINAESALENEFSMTRDLRILSSYRIETGDPDEPQATVWIITEADRSATTYLLPDEY